MWDGLRIVSDAIGVHYDSDHPGRLQADAEADRYRRGGKAHRFLRNGEALVVDGDAVFTEGWLDGADFR